MFLYINTAKTYYVGGVISINCGLFHRRGFRIIIKKTEVEVSLGIAAWTGKGRK